MIMPNESIITEPSSLKRLIPANSRIPARIMIIPISNPKIAPMFVRVCHCSLVCFSNFCPHCCARSPNSSPHCSAFFPNSSAPSSIFCSQVLFDVSRGVPHLVQYFSVGLFLVPHLVQ